MNPGIHKKWGSDIHRKFPGGNWKISVMKSSLRSVIVLSCLIGVVMLLFGTLAYGEPSGLWYNTTVDATGDVGQWTSVAIGPDNYPKISYDGVTTHGLKFAWQNESGWNNITLDSDKWVGTYTALAIGPDGYSRIGYRDESNWDAKYAWQNTTGWYNTTIDSAGNVGGSTSLAIGPDGYSRMSYYNWTGQDLRYAVQDAAGWTITTIDSTGDVGWYTSLAIGPDGYPRISYLDFTNRNLKFAFQNASGWFNETVDSIDETGWETSLAIGIDGNPRIAYYDRTNGNLMYAIKDGSGWHTAPVDSTGQVGEYPSIKVGPDGYPRISYYDRTNGNLKYAYQDLSGWHPTVLDSIADVGQYTSLAIDPDGSPVISYYNVTGGDLKVAWFVQTPEVDSITPGQADVDMGIYADIYGSHFQPGAAVILRRSGSEDIVARDVTLVSDSHINCTIWIPRKNCADRNPEPCWYLNAGSWDVVVRNPDGQGGTLAGGFQVGIPESKGKWNNETVFNDVLNHERGPDVYPSLQIGPDGYPRICFYKKDGNLTYAWKNQMGWHSVAIDKNGTYLSMVIGEDGFPRASYVDVTSSPYKLKFAWQDVSGWYKTTVADSNASDTRLVLGSDGYPRISYRYNGLMYAVQDSGGWHTTLLDSTDIYTGRYSSITIGPDGFSRISYSTFGATKYAWQDVAGWHTEILDNSSQLKTSYMLSSNAIGKDGTPLVSYTWFNNNGYLVKYAWKDAIGWYTRFLDSLGDNGGISMLVGSDGYPRIAYGSKQGGSLKYSRMDALGWHSDVADVCNYNDTYDLSFALDEENIPSIAYIDQDGESLKYAWFSPEPTVTGITPASGAPGTFVTVTNLSGTYFWPDDSSRTVVNLTKDGEATITATDVTILSKSSLSCIIPIPPGTATGSWDIVLTNPDGQVASLPGGFTISTANPIPLTSRLNPSSVVAGGTDFTLVVTGSNFISGSIVKWNGVSKGTNYVSPTQLNATITSTDIGSAGSASVTVFNPAPGGGTSNAQTFTITAPNPIPSTSSLNPSSAVAGGSDFTLVVTGSNFAAGSVVKWNGVTKGTSYVSPTQLNATITSTDIGSAGSSSVTVFNPAPGGGTSNAQTFTITVPPTAPTVTSIHPAKHKHGGKAFSATINGTEFRPGVSGTGAILWKTAPTKNITASLVNVQSSSGLIAKFKIPKHAKTGMYNVTVINPDGQKDTLLKGFKILT